MGTGYPGPGRYHPYPREINGVSRAVASKPGNSRIIAHLDRKKHLPPHGGGSINPLPNAPPAPVGRAGDPVGRRLIKITEALAQIIFVGAIDKLGTDRPRFMLHR